jgi:hypothetical protein
MRKTRKAGKARKAGIWNNTARNCEKKEEILRNSTKNEMLRFSHTSPRLAKKKAGYLENLRIS